MLKDISTHHASCITAKKNCTVGLGFYGSDEVVSGDNNDNKDNEAGNEVPQTTEEIISLLMGNQKVNSKVDDELDGLTHFGFLNELLDIVEDFMDVGTGYMEVARDSRNKITGLNHVPASQVRVVTVGNRLCYLYTGEDGSSKFFAMFGHKDWLMNNTELPNVLGSADPTQVSEIIPFVMSSNRVKFYGYPDWVSAAVDIELTASAKQFKADFYNNRGVLDFIVAVTGSTMDDESFKKIEDMAKGSVGAGRAWRSAALNLANPDARLQVEKLAMESQPEQQFALDCEILAQHIVSAHRVPPLLANILIPGKLGASNEFINSLVAFQLLVVGPYQYTIQSQLARTLGNKKLNGGLKLSADDFRLRTITSQINITGMDAISKSRTEATDGSENEDRDYEEGVKE
jgi:hypothetical protein